MSLPATMQAFANKREGDKLTIGMHELPTPTVKDPKDIIIKMEAAPVNPSDLTRNAMVARFMAKPEDVQAARPSVVQTTLPESAQSNFEDGKAAVLGSEGCGIVVAAGDSEEAQALMGKRVALSIGVAYVQYVKFRVGTPFASFAVLPDDIGPLEGASVFTNPLTVVGFVHTMEHNGHKAIVHTAAGSQVGRMLIKYCKQLNVPLVNIVRKDEVATSLKELGAEHVVVSTAETYKADLLAAIKATGATIGFDATGGGDLAYDILSAIEQNLRDTEGSGAGAKAFYGPPSFRQVYRYGGLDKHNTKMPMSLGVGNWTYGGWLMPFHFQKFGPEHLQTAIDKAVAGLKDTFSTTYGEHLTLDQAAASPEQYLATLQSQSEKKFLITPNGPL